MRTCHIAFQAIPPAQEGTPSVQSDSPATAPGGGAPPAEGGFGSMFMLLMFVPLILFMFWQSRSQQKKQETAINALKKGDRVVTQSGLVGRLIEVDTRYAKLELAPGVKVQVLRTSLLGLDAEDSAKSTGDKTTSDKGSDTKSGDKTASDKGSDTKSGDKTASDKGSDTKSGDKSGSEKKSEK